MNKPEVDAERAKDIFDGIYKALTMTALLKLAAKDTFDTPSEADAFRGGVELAAELIDRWLEVPFEHASELSALAAGLEL